MLSTLRVLCMCLRSELEGDPKGIVRNGQTIPRCLSPTLNGPADLPDSGRGASLALAPQITQLCSTFILGSSCSPELEPRLLTAFLSFHSPDFLVLSPAQSLRALTGQWRTCPG